MPVRTRSSKSRRPAAPSRRIGLATAGIALFFAACDEPAATTTDAGPAPPASTTAVPGGSVAAKPPTSAEPGAPPSPSGSADGAPTPTPSAVASATPGDPPPAASASAVASVTPPPPPPPPAPSLPAPAAGSADAVAAEVDEVYLGRNTFKAKFKQVHTQKIAGVEKTSTGVVFVERPNKISFRYDPPNQNRIVSDGVTLKVYVADDQQMVEQPVGKTEYPGALAFIMGQGLRPSFSFDFNEKAKFEGGPVLLGTPRTPTPHYKNVFFYVDKALLAKDDANTIRRVLILDTQGNKNRFDFTDASRPASIPASEFTFSPPAGTNIVKP